jgi:hypothetical protein
LRPAGPSLLERSSDGGLLQPGEPAEGASNLRARDRSNCIDQDRAYPGNLILCQPRYGLERYGASICFEMAPVAVPKERRGTRLELPFYFLLPPEAVR